MKRGLAAALALATLLVAGCASEEPDAAAGRDGATGPPAAAEVPEIDLSTMEPEVAERFAAARRAVVADPASAAAWGRLGMVAHAHELFAEAAAAYRRAESLDRADVRWPYFLGDVLTVQGEDLAAAEAAFRRALALRPDYAPAHWRLGAAQVAQGEPEAAARALGRALELAPGLQPARLALAQVRLSQGDLDRAQALLDEILRAEPEHAQALATLANVAMRQGRGEEARRIAERAEAAPFYNLYSDPLMDQVVAEGASTVLIWERARAFLQNGR
ncbi:MAG TPA: tetratricopeptide repeat protein, partial [Thermoanaerobaculia bacterium]